MRFLSVTLYLGCLAPLTALAAPDDPPGDTVAAPETSVSPDASERAPGATPTDALSDTASETPSEVGGEVGNERRGEPPNDGLEDVDTELLNEPGDKDVNENAIPNAPRVPRYRPWADDLDMSYEFAQGSIEICDALAFPARFVPYVGEIAAIVLEWACLVPGAFAVDFVGLYHGKQDGQVWQALTSLIAAKLWRDLTRWPVIIGIGVVGAVVLVAATAVSVGGLVGGAPTGIPPTFLPVLFTGVLVGSGVTYVLARKLRKWGQAFIFEGLYEGLSSDFPDDDVDGRRLQAQDEAWLKHPLNGVERAWMLASTAAGSDPDGELLHAIPVVGRLDKTSDGAAALKEDMRRVGKDVLGEEVPDETLLDGTIDALANAEGTLGALADVGLILGGALFVGGSLFAAMQFQQDANVTTWASLTLGFGIVGTIVGTSALFLLALREIPKMLRAFIVPLAWGVVPAGGWSGWFAVPPESEIVAPLDPPPSTPKESAKGRAAPAS